MRSAIPAILLLFTACGPATQASDREPCPSRVRLAPADEPGEGLFVTAEVRREGAPVQGLRAEIYQTDGAGYYRRGPEGEELGREQARLQAVVCTGPDGRFEIESIQPERYPDQGPPAHVHVFLETGERRTRDLTFELDDPLCVHDGDTARCHLDVLLD